MTKTTATTTSAPPTMPKALNTTLSPLVSEFETAEQKASYTAWLRAKVAASLADPRLPIPHDEVERRMAERFARLRDRQSNA